MDDNTTPLDDGLVDVYCRADIVQASLGYYPAATFVKGVARVTPDHARALCAHDPQSFSMKPADQPPAGEAKVLGPRSSKGGK